MRSVKYLLAAGAAALMSSAALAADLPLAPPPAYMPPPPPDFGGWYLRGDIGMSNQKVKRLYNVKYDEPGTSIDSQRLNFDSAGIYGVGVGYVFNNWLRGDITGEYRASANFKGLDLVSFPGGMGSDLYRASKSEWLIMANAYVDLGTWWNVTPFIGAGIGASRNTISNFTDQGLVVAGGPALPSTAYADTASKWNLAWAVHAGLAYQVTPSFTIELAYRYANLGHARSGDLYAFDGTNDVYNPMEFRRITSHDVKLGVRWALDPMPAYLPPPMPPLVTKG